MPNDIRTTAIVLRRTNYGETDRIINVLTPLGQFAAMAKGVRKEKSRLAGGIELFSVADVVIHQGRSELGILTSAKMLRFYSSIMSDLSKIELASECLRQAERASKQTDSEEYFSLLDQALAGLHHNYPPQLVKTWYQLNLIRASGEEINLLRDCTGEPLMPDLAYFWDSTETALRANPQGNVKAPEIKLARLMLSAPLKAVARVEQADELVQAIQVIAQSFSV